MDVREERRGGAVVVSVDGSLGDVDLRALDSALSGKAKESVVVDLAKVQTIHSQAISVLLAAWRAARREGGRFAIANPRGTVRRVFDVTRLATFVPVKDSLEEALETVADTTAPEKKVGAP